MASVATDATGAFPPPSLAQWYVSGTATCIWVALRAISVWEGGAVVTVPRADKDVDKITVLALSPPLLISFCIFMDVSFFSGWGGRNLYLKAVVHA